MSARQVETPAVSLVNAVILRGNRLVLRDFSIEAHSGEIVWVRGANGSGKSTLFRALAGLLPLAAGRSSVTGSIALTDDNNALDAEQSVEDNLHLWSKMDGVSNAVLEKALEALDLVSLAELPVRFLSAGQKRRVSLARMIASGASIWLLDEPYNGLDQANVARLDEALHRHTASGGIALIASHIAPTVNVARSVMLDQPRQRAAT
jgi:heme exporter protein A